MKEPEKIRPIAQVKFSDGVDGRNPHYYISYNCPNCYKDIRKGDIACTKCGTFFDWSKKAHLKVHYSAEWE